MARKRRGASIEGRRRERAEERRVGRLRRLTYLILAGQLRMLVDVDGHEVEVGVGAGEGLEDGREDAAGLAPAVC